MKRIALATSVAVGIAASCAVKGEQWTDPETGIVWNYTVSESGIGIGRHYWEGQAVPSNTTGCVVIPRMIDNRPVVALNPMAFSGCGGITEVEIPDSVVRIGAFAFDNCCGMRRIVIPEGVESMGRWAFCGCVGLESADIGGMLAAIPDDAFCGCASLSSVNVRNGVKYVGSSAFLGCGKLECVRLPGSVKSIGDKAFKYCYKIRQAVVSGELGRIENVFPHSFESLTNVEIAVGSRMVVDRAFLDCHALVSVTVPASVVCIGHEAFAQCENLTAVRFMGNAPVAMLSPNGEGAEMFRASDVVTNYVLRCAKGWPANAWPEGDGYARPVAELHCREKHGELLKNMSVGGAGAVDVRYSSIYGQDIQSLGSWYSQVKDANGGVAMQLNAQARPRFAARAADDRLFEVENEAYITMRVDNVKPLLYYGLGWSETPNGEYAVEPGLWLRADANGELPGDVKAPKGNGSARFFRVKVTDNPSVAQ